MRLRTERRWMLFGSDRPRRTIARAVRRRKKAASASRTHRRFVTDEPPICRVDPYRTLFVVSRARRWRVLAPVGTGSS
jgi:hypothetical protein